MHALVADASVAFGFVLVIVLALFAAVVGLVTLISKVVLSMLRFVFGGAKGAGDERRRTDVSPSGTGLDSRRWHNRSCRQTADTTCDNDLCGWRNPPNAKYCGRCGQALRQESSRG